MRRQLPLGQPGATRRRPILGLLLCLLVAAASGCTTSHPTVVDGRLDLRHWDFGARGNVELLGTWEVCWGQLLEPGQTCPSSWRAFPVPGLWSDEADTGPFGGRGVATYRLRIALPRARGPLSLAVGAPFTAYRLWIDGVQRGGEGVVGRTPSATKMGVHNRVYVLPAQTKELDLLVQVANFRFRSGGLRRIWVLGDQDAVQRGVDLAILREGMVFSVGVVVGLAYLLIFGLGRSEQARGYFGMAALVLGLRAIPASVSGFGALLAPHAGFALMTRLEYLGTALAVFAGAGYARTKVQGVAPPLTTRAIQLAALALAAVVAFSPFSVALETLPVQYVLPLLVLAVLILCYGRAWLRGVPGVRVTAVASTLYLGVVVHDILRTALSAHIFAPIELYPYAMVLWLLAEGSDLMQRFYRSFVRAESLSEDLAEANFELKETESAIVRFVPFDFLSILGKRSIRDVETGDRASTRLSVLHCGFHWKTADVGARTPESDFDAVHALASRVEPLIHRHGGFVNHLEAEGIQAFFPRRASAAVAAALDITRSIGHPGRDPASLGRRDVDLAIGIDTGPVLLGTVGSSEHLLRGVVGEAVDTARRIEALAHRCGIEVLISGATREELGEVRDLVIRPSAGSLLQTPAGPVEVYEVRSAGSPEGA